ncbi:MAG: phosphoenolpyruvate carboxykinase (GTP) [Gammaproteobacteria bacterium]|nr:phosphoenolpyruvate carboxykinase (GTP) [Gammaproteobacteria bacterium]
MTTKNDALAKWVDEVAARTRPEEIVWCDGSDAEFDRMVDQMLESGTLMRLNEETHPNCYLHRSDPSDVARVEHLTYVCTRDEEDAGPNNHWMDPDEAHTMVDGLFEGCMEGRTMYVIPYCMGPIDSPLSRNGVEITDSPYVVANMKIMARIGTPALERIERDGTFVKGLHSIGDLDPEKRFILHFPEELYIKSIGSGYGGNALLGKKCHALRIASWQARTEGWLAEHMLIVGLESPQGETHYIACAFPSACGKTNLAMLIPPEQYEGWKVTTVGDDICWMHLRDDGRLWAINPESGYFGVVPGTNEWSNKNAYDTLKSDAIFTNVGVTANNEPWWEEKDDGKEPVLDWKGNPYDAEVGPAAHPNSRFTVSAKNNPVYSPMADHPDGVPISAVVFGGRRKDVAPLVYEAKDWDHGVLVGASCASEMTAAAIGGAGQTRRDPMAMKPFCGYNFGDYFAHWLSFGGKSDKLPKIFCVNWFRRDQDGKFLWPGFGENMRVLAWIVERCQGERDAKETPIGFVPKVEDIDINGIDVSSETMEALLSVDPALWEQETVAISEYFAEFGDRIPQTLLTELEKITSALQSKAA